MLLTLAPAVTLLVEEIGAFGEGRGMELVLTEGRGAVLEVVKTAVVVLRGAGVVRTAEGEGVEVTAGRLGVTEGRDDAVVVGGVEEKPGRHRDKVSKLNSNIRPKIAMDKVETKVRKIEEIAYRVRKSVEWSHTVRKDVKVLRRVDKEEVRSFVIIAANLDGAITLDGKGKLVVLLWSGGYVLGHYPIFWTVKQRVGIIRQVTLFKQPQVWIV